MTWRLLCRDMLTATTVSFCGNKSGLWPFLQRPFYLLCAVFCHSLTVGERLVERGCSSAGSGVISWDDCVPVLTTACHFLFSNPPESGHFLLTVYSREAVFWWFESCLTL